MYNIEYTKNYIRDLSVTLEYIALALANPRASIKLKQKVDKAEEYISQFPEGFAEFDTNNRTEHTYRRYIVNNYVILYYILDNVVVFSRFIYAKRNMDDIEI